MIGTYRKSLVVNGVVTNDFRQISIDQMARWNSDFLVGKRLGRWGECLVRLNLRMERYCGGLRFLVRESGGRISRFWGRGSGVFSKLTLGESCNHDYKRLSTRLLGQRRDKSPSLSSRQNRRLTIVECRFFLFPSPPTMLNYSQVLPCFQLNSQTSKTHN